MTTEPIIPLNRPMVVGAEAAYVAAAVGSSRWAGDGEYTSRCHRLLEEALGTRKALLTTSCTDALEMAGLLLGLEPGDEVIVPSFTFVSTVNAFILRGAVPRFADIRPDTLNIDERVVEALITPRTRAIVPVHYAGVGCEMDEIGALAARHGLAVVEDNAHGLFGKYRGRYLGTLGCLATQSFHETKNFTCGEGGALLVNDERYVERAEVLREKGTNRSRFFRGEVDKYTWVDLGSSYLPSNLLAAFLLAQLEARDTIQARRRAIWERYVEGLAGWASEQGVRLPAVPVHCEHSYHLFYMLLPTPGARQAFIEDLKSRGIMAAFHYVPLHTAPMGERYGGRKGDCPVAEQVADRLVRLPFYHGLSDGDQERVIRAVTGWRVGA